MKNLTRAAAVLAAALLILTGCTAENTEPAITEGTQAAALDISAIRPQDDFYGYVNAEYLSSAMPEYGETTAGTFCDVEAVTAVELFGIIRDCAESDEDFTKGSTEYMIREVYKQALSFDDSADVLADVRACCDEIDSAPDINALFKLWAGLNRSYGAATPFAPTVRQNYFKSGDYALLIEQKTSMCRSSIKELAGNDAACLNMKSFISNSLMALGEDKETAENKAEAAVYLALDISAATDYTRAANPFAAFTEVSDSDLAQMLDNLDESAISLFFGLENNPYGCWYVRDVTQLEKINALLDNADLEQWKTIAKAELVSAELQYIAPAADSLAAYSSAADKEYTACMDIATFLFYDELSTLYAKKYYTPELDSALTSMCEELRASYRELISTTATLTPEGRAALIKKLENIRFITPDTKGREFDESRASLIKNSYPETVRAIRENAYDQSIQCIGAPFDIDTPRMASYELNAAYNPNNTVTVTAAILHSPFFEAGADKGTDLGGLGFIIAHEIGHGFDTTCLDYDENGLYDPNWLSEADRQSIRESAEKIQSYYSTYTVLGVYPVNGVKTCGENFADLGAAECAVNILKGNDEELKSFFGNFARIWASATVDSSIVEALDTDEHSPDRVRVNAILSSLDDFYRLYDVKEGDLMYKAPEERISRW